LRTEFETSVSVNSLVVVESLAADERKTGTYLVSDIEAAFLKERIELRPLAAIASVAEFRKLVADLVERAQVGLRPILHIEAHGLKDGSGLLFLPSGDRLAWPEFADICRDLNEATKNNLVVVLATCQGYEALMGIDILRPAPYCFMAGPDRSVMNVELIGATSEFYLEIFRSGSLSEAAKHLPKDFRLLNCEALLVRAYVRYVEDHRGKAGAARKERLLTKAREIYPQQTLAVLRQWIKRRVTDDQRHFARNQARFLMSAEPENRGRFSVRWADIESALKRRDRD
jgi:hypothetical protein